VRSERGGGNLPWNSTTALKNNKGVSRNRAWKADTSEKEKNLAYPTALDSWSGEERNDYGRSKQTEDAPS
jgi:hypothetical protein